MVIVIVQMILKNNISILFPFHLEMYLQGLYIRAHKMHRGYTVLVLLEVTLRSVQVL